MRQLLNRCRLLFLIIKNKSTAVLIRLQTLVTVWQSRYSLGRMSSRDSIAGSIYHRSSCLRAKTLLSMGQLAAKAACTSVLCENPAGAMARPVAECTAHSRARVLLIQTLPRARACLYPLYHPTPLPSVILLLYTYADNL